MPHLLATALSGAAMAVLLPTGTAFATPSAPSDPAVAPGTTALWLAIGKPSLAGGSSIRSVVLRCDPAGGGHPRAAQACEQLVRNGGRFTQPAGNTVCTLQYAPVQVIASGLWRAQPVTFVRSFGNTCQLRAHTGVLFDF